MSTMGYIDIVYSGKSKKKTKDKRQNKKDKGKNLIGRMEKGEGKMER